MFGNAISEVTFYDPGTPPSLSGSSDSRASPGLPAMPKQRVPHFQQVLSLLPLPTPVAAKGTPPGLSERGFSLLAGEGTAWSTNLRG